VKRLLSCTLAIFSFVCLLVAMEPRAWGYVDPGTGFLAIQTIASVAAGVGYFLRRRLRALFGGKTEEKTASVPVTAKRGNSPNAA